MLWHPVMQGWKPTEKTHPLGQHARYLLIIILHLLIHGKNTNEYTGKNENTAQSHTKTDTYTLMLISGDTPYYYYTDRTGLKQTKKPTHKSANVYQPVVGFIKDSKISHHREVEMWLLSCKVGLFGPLIQIICDSFLLSHQKYFLWPQCSFKKKKLLYTLLGMLVLLCKYSQPTIVSKSHPVPLSSLGNI